MPIYQENEYDKEVRMRKYKEKFAFIIAQILRGVFYIIKLFLGIIWGGVKGVLQTFGLPVR